ncbi:hypothetical protein Tco_0596327 [Tanacetum coccineum]
MAQFKYCDKHNQVGFLRKPDESAGFAEIVDFLRGSNLRYALTTNPTIYDSLLRQFWQTATTNTNAEGTLEIKATIDTISLLPDKKIFGNMKRGFRGAPRPLLPSMLLVATNPNAGQAHDAVAPSQLSSSTPTVPSTSSPPAVTAPTPIPITTPPPIPTPTTTPPPIPSPTPPPIPSPTQITDTEPTPFEHTYEESSRFHITSLPLPTRKPKTAL